MKRYYLEGGFKTEEEFKDYRNKVLRSIGCYSPLFEYYFGLALGNASGKNAIKLINCFRELCDKYYKEL